MHTAACATRQPPHPQQRQSHAFPSQWKGSQAAHHKHATFLPWMCPQTAPGADTNCPAAVGAAPIMAMSSSKPCKPDPVKGPDMMPQHQHPRRREENSRKHMHPTVHPSVPKTTEPSHMHSRKPTHSGGSSWPAVCLCWTGSQARHGQLCWPSPAPHCATSPPRCPARRNKLEGTKKAADQAHSQAQTQRAAGCPVVWQKPAAAPKAHAYRCRQRATTKAGWEAAAPHKPTPVTTHPHTHT